MIIDLYFHSYVTYKWSKIYKLCGMLYLLINMQWEKSNVGSSRSLHAWHVWTHVHFRIRWCQETYLLFHCKKQNKTVCLLIWSTITAHPVLWCLCSLREPAVMMRWPSPPWGHQPAHAWKRRSPWVPSQTWQRHVLVASLVRDPLHCSFTLPVTW